MHPATPFSSAAAISPAAASFLTRGALPELANFRDKNGHAVSFFFSLQSIPDKSHHTEVVLVRDLVREELLRFRKKDAPGLDEDLEAVLTQTEEIRESPRHWRILYACRGQSFLRRFDLPAPKPIRQLSVGGRFLLAPMFGALEYCTPFGVVIFERGRARAFVVRGLEIEEYSGRMPKEKLELHVRDWRITAEDHVERHVEEHVKAYFKELAAKVRAFMAAEKLRQVVFGCGEILWGEAEPEFADFEKGALIGRFAPAEYEMPVEKAREAAYPIFEENRRKIGGALWQEIRNYPARGVAGVNAIMERLVEGRVQKLMLGKPVANSVGGPAERYVSECDNCGRLQARTDGPCIFCEHASLHDVEAEEGLIRQAVLTDAEILTYAENEIPGFRGAAAWLRY